MKRTLIFKLLIIFVILIFSSNGQSLCPCGSNNDILRCEVTSTSPAVNIDSCISNVYNSINIIYNGTVILNLTTSSTKPIVIKPVDGSDSHTLQISEINTKTIRIEIVIYLSLNQTSSPLFTTSSSIVAPTSTLSIKIIQNIPDAMNFKVFGSISTKKIFANYELIFDTTNPNSGSLYLPNLIFGLTSLTSILISGNKHILVNSAQTPSSINVTRLSLKNLRLYDQILVNFYDLQGYSIEECEYNKTSLFLNSTQNYNISLELKNNNPLDSVLPFHADAFKQLGTLANLVLIEPKLNSSCLKAIQNLLTTAKILINLKEYDKSDMIYWGNKKLKFSELTIQNIKSLTVFPAVFFNKFHAIQRATLKGIFNLEESDICIFVGIMRQPYAIYPILILDSPKNKTNDWNRCADTYITAINQRSTNDVKCPPGNTCEDCQRWANETDQCDLISYENAYRDQTEGSTGIFFYNNSQLYLFFKQRLWLNETTRPPGSSPKEDRINIAAIIGSVCGLIIAMIILGLTIVFIYRYRQKDANKNMFSTPEEKYKPSSDDSTHVSIATTKTSQSSRYALEKSFFPPMQPNDEIAPPLYTAPSESVRSVSAYNLPSAPPAPRDSVSTHATHFYETVDP